MSLTLPKVDNVTLILTHKGCTDGWASAFIAKQRFPDAEIRGVAFGELPPEVHGHDVLITDFSFDREDLTMMEIYANSLTVLDHHATAEEHLRGLPYCYFDFSRSGASLTWDCLFPKEPRHPIVSYVEDQDLWHHKLDYSWEVNAVIDSYRHDLSSWETLWSRPEWMGMKEGKTDEEELLRLQLAGNLLTEGQAIRRSHDRLVERMVDGGEVREIDGYRLRVINGTALQSQVGHAADEGVDAVAIWSYRRGEVIVSLRSAQNGINVAEYAETYGGGGHPHSAAFRTSVEKMKGRLFS